MVKWSEKNGWYPVYAEDDEDQFVQWFDELGQKLPQDTHIGWEHDDHQNLKRKKGVYSEFDDYIINQRYKERRELW